MYFDEYYQMRGCDNIDALKQRVANKTLEKSDHPMLGLIRKARLDLDSLLTPTRTRDLKNKLEGAGNHLTKNIVKYWSQNKNLQMRFDVRHAQPGDPQGMQNGTNIWAEVYNTLHMVTTELGARSRGFVWFFSFLAWYGDVQRGKENVLLLLDEPGLSLHGKAQGDLLRYFEEELVPNHQLIYSTHSPFMVDPARFDRVRIVQDRRVDADDDLPDGEAGTKVTIDVLESTDDSLFPLQGALGYDIAQTLFVGPKQSHCRGRVRPALPLGDDRRPASNGPRRSLCRMDNHSGWWIRQSPYVRCLAGCADADEHCHTNRLSGEGPSGN